MKKVNGSIVLYNSIKKDIDNIIESFFKNSCVNKLFLIDNSPNDDARYWYHNKRIIYIKSKNNGYGSGHNIAIKESLNNVLFHVVLNPDIILYKDTLDELFSYGSKNEDIGLIMPKVVYPEGNIQKLCKLIPTPLNLFARRFLPQFIVNKLNYNYELNFFDYNSIIDVPILSGCFMFINTSKLKITGLFDENYFMYCEDFDLSRRINKISRTVYYPKVTIIHNHAKESYKNYKMMITHIKSAIYYFNKWGWFFDKERIKINKKVSNDIKNTLF